MQSSRFNNIFKTQNSALNNLTLNTNEDFTDDNISEFSSGSEWNLSSEQENQESPIRISGYSSDENVSDSINNSFVQRNSSYNLNSSHKTSTATKRRRRPPRKPLTKVKVGRQPKKLLSNIETKRVLAPLNSPAKEQRTSKTNESSWHKVRNVFQTLESTPRRRNSYNSTQSGMEMFINSPNDIAEETIEWSSSSSASETSCNATQICSQVISTPSTSSQVSNPPTELDLLLALIERENNMEKRKSHMKVKSSQKRCRKDGYLQELLHVLEAVKLDKKYLEHDKKFGLQSGTQLKVVAMEKSFGVHFAICQLGVDAEDGHLMRIVLDADMAKQVKVGSNLEAFFNASDALTSSGRFGEAMPTFVQPHRLLLL